MLTSAALRLLSLAAIALAIVGIAAKAAADTPTDEQVNQTVAFIEFAFGFPLDAATVQAVRSGMTIDMSSDPNGALATLKDMNDTMAWVHSHDAASVRLVRSLIEPELVAAWQGDTSASAATARAMVAAWRKHNHIIAQGHPPLRRSVVDAYIAMFEFVSKQAGKTVPAAIRDHAGFTAKIASMYAKASAAEQMKFNKVETLWLALQNIWSTASAADKAAMRDHWSGRTTTAAAGPPQTTTSTSEENASPRDLAYYGSEKYKEKLFVDRATDVYMATWTNPFSVY